MLTSAGASGLITCALWGALIKIWALYRPSRKD